MSDGKQPIWRPTREFPMPEMIRDHEDHMPPVPSWAGRLGRGVGLAVLLLISALLVAPLVWAVRQAWGWALG